MTHGKVAKTMQDNRRQGTRSGKSPVMKPDKMLIYSCATTYREYLATSSRLDFLEMRAREIRLLPEDQAYFTAYPDLTHWLVVAADDSLDTLLVLPILVHIAAQVPCLSLRVVREEDAPALLAALVDDPAVLESLSDSDLPLLLSFDEEWQFQEQWGPRPQAAEPILDQWLAEHADYAELAEDDSAEGQAAYASLFEDLLYAMRVWYNTSLNYACGEELRALLARWHTEVNDENGDDL